MYLAVGSLTCFPVPVESVRKKEPLLRLWRPLQEQILQLHHLLYKRPNENGITVIGSTNYETSVKKQTKQLIPWDVALTGVRCNPVGSMFSMLARSS